MERAAAEANETMKRRLLELTRVPRVGRLVLLVRGCRAERELFAHTLIRARGVWWASPPKTMLLT